MADLGEFGELRAPSEADEPILAKPVRAALLEWLTEIWAEEELTAVGLKARRRALFDGKPGVGKTTLAHHLAARLGVPMLIVRPELLIDKWLGATGRNIGELFDAAKRAEEPLLLFFDEFDAIAITRGRAEQSAQEERNSWVNTLLQRLEQHDGFVIAATNFGANIDPAIWRRFDIHVSLALPGPFERARIIQRYLLPFGLPKPALGHLADSFEGAPPALMRQFCEAMKRQIVIGPKVGWNMHRDAVIERIIASVQPHPDLGKPRLWSQGRRDKAVASMTWPLPRASEIDDAAEPAPENVTPMRGRDPLAAGRAP